MFVFLLLFFCFAFLLFFYLQGQVPRGSAGAVAQPSLPPAPLRSRHVAVCKTLRLLSSPLLSPGLTAAAAAAANAAIAEAMKVKKIKLEAMSGYHSNANHHGADGENGDLSSSVGEERPRPTHAHTPSLWRETKAQTVYLLSHHCRRTLRSHARLNVSKKHFRNSSILLGTV